MSCVCVYYKRAGARAQHGLAGVLRHMLLLQAKDKDFLLTAIANVSNGDWRYSPKGEEGAGSHTWRYLNEVRKPSNSSYHFDASRLSRSLADRPVSCLKENRPSSSYERKSHDGDTDSSFSWQGSGNELSNVDPR